jgi:hypothetical protein
MGFSSSGPGGRRFKSSLPDHGPIPVQVIMKARVLGKQPSGGGVDMWMHRRRVLRWFLLCFIAETVSSWRVWYSFPNDNIRVGYPGFAEFEVGRLRFWVPILVLVGLTGSAMRWLAKRNNRLLGSKENAEGKRLWLHRSPYLVSAIALEIGTTIVYWYWNQARMPEIFGWPIFRFYLLGHLLPWAIVISLGSFPWNRLANGRLAFYVMLFGITVIAVYFMTLQHCVCTTCVVIDPTTRIPIDQGNPCHCASYADQLFQSAFGHHESHSESMAKSSAPCEIKK